MTTHCTRTLALLLPAIVATAGATLAAPEARADTCDFEPPMPPVPLPENYDWTILGAAWCSELVDCGMVDTNQHGNCVALYLEATASPSLEIVPPDDILRGDEVSFEFTCQDSEEYKNGTITCVPCGGGDSSNDGGTTEGGEESSEGGGGYCGDGTCDPSYGEDCGTCEADCRCGYPGTCVDAMCLDGCDGRSCGPDLYDPTRQCGSCPDDPEWACNDEGQCECTDVILSGDHGCLPKYDLCGELIEPEECGPGLVCDGSTDMCVECINSLDCGSGDCCEGTCVSLGCC